MKRVLNYLVLGSIVLAACFTVPLTVFAEADNPGDYLHTRTYVGLLGTSVNLDKSGEFTGLNYSRINKPYEIVLIPAVAQNFGFGILIGHREEAYAMEISYWLSRHTGSFGPANLGSVSGMTSDFTTTAYDPVSYNAVNLDFKRYFFTQLQVQPFVNLGVNFPWLVVDNAAADSSGRIGQATLAGLGVNLGLGVEYYFSPNLSVVGGAYQRWISLDQYKGFTGQFNPISQYGDSTSNAGSGLNFTVGTTVGF
jgi:hypothetical protein